MAKAARLGDMIEERKERIRGLKREGWSVRLKLALEFEKHLDLCFTLLSSFSTFVNTYLCDKLPSAHATTIAYFAGIVENIYLKLRCLKMELLLTLYAPHSRHAEELKSTRTNLKHLHQTLTHRQRALDAQLATYAGVGEEFARVVEIYRRVCKDVGVLEGDLERIG
ncbi:hypothetical protein HDV00_012323 [Rhizophlyctis rosea]|nr:hypothetical protein HDV00_012323 [Rhizophlyctis rosea]